MRKHYTSAANGTRRSYLAWQQVRAPRGSGRLRSVSVTALYLLMAGLFLLYWVRVDVFRVGYELNQIILEQQRLQNTHDQLCTEHAMLVQPQRLESICSARLKMRPAANNRKIVVAR